MKIEDLIAKTEYEYEMPQGTLHEDSAFKSVINWSSINAVVMTTMIEFEFGIILSTEELNKASTMLDLFKLIKMKLDHA